MGKKAYILNDYPSPIIKKIKIFLLLMQHYWRQMSWSKYAYYAIILGGGLRAMMILITRVGVGGPPLGISWLRIMCILP